jgi:hypothetical protein
MLLEPFQQAIQALPIASPVSRRGSSKTACVCHRTPCASPVGAVAACQLPHHRLESLHHCELSPGDGSAQAGAPMRIECFRRLHKNALAKPTTEAKPALYNSAEF